MALTAEDMKNMREMVEDVIDRRVEPRFQALETKMDTRFGIVEARLDGIDARLESIEEDLSVVKDIVKDHSFEIARLKHKSA